MPALFTLTLTELISCLEGGTCSSVEVVDDLLAEIGQRNSALNAYTLVDEDQVRADAAAADVRRSAGERAPLLGVPIGIKDLLNVKGQPCACSSHLLKGYTAPYDATAVARLRDAGAIPFGRLNMDEFAMGSSNEHSADGACCNPHDLSRVPGGSSGGSASAVAGNLAIAALGSDTGGSIRQPAAFCGCVGLKPTYGRVSRFGLTAFASSLDQVGPLTKTVEDAALLLQVLAGGDRKDSTSIHEEVPNYGAALQGGLKGLRIGVPKEYFGSGMDAEVERAVRARIDAASAAGADVVEVSLPHTEYAIAVYYILATAEASANLARFDGVRYGNRVEGADPLELYGNTREAGFGTEVKRRIILGTYVLSSGYYDAYYLKAQKARRLIAQDFEAVFKECDALLGPVAPTPAFKMGEKSDDPLEMYLNDVCTVPINLAGIPAMSLPCGMTEAGLPIGLQLIAPSLGEPMLFRVGQALEQPFVPGGAS